MLRENEKMLIIIKKRAVKPAPSFYANSNIF